jgi:hypothetical protein
MAKVEIDDSFEGHVEALEEELRSALRHIAEVASRAITVEQVAWWLCANHRHLVQDLEGAMYEAVIANATAHGPPPKGGSWVDWVSDAGRPVPHHGSGPDNQ